MYAKHCDRMVYKKPFLRSNFCPVIFAQPKPKNLRKSLKTLKKPKKNLKPKLFQKS